MQWRTISKRLAFAVTGAIFVIFSLGIFANEARAIIGMPLTPMSYAGVARRTARRTMYAGAAYGAAAYGAAAVAPMAPVAALPAGCAPGVPCGGAVYQPAYSG